MMKYLTAIFSIILLIFSFHAHSFCDQVPTMNENHYTWYHHDQVNRGVVLMVHGLNLRPIKMQSLAKSLAQKGYKVLNISLLGHRDNGDDEMRHIQKTQWIKDFQSAYCQAKNEAHLLNTPLYFLGFSLGSLISLHAQFTNPKIIFSKQVLLAPAYKLTTTSHFIKALYFLKDTLLIPSRSPKDYRANSGTSLNAYKALFQLIDETKSIKSQPTLFIMDRADELVSYKKTKALSATDSQFKFFEINASLSSFKHLIVDSKSLGTEEFKHMIEKIDDFYNAN